MSELKLSPRVLEFLGDYAKKAGKDPARIVEEAVSQALMRHSSPEKPSPHDAKILIPDRAKRQLLALLPDMDPDTETDSPFGVLMERLPDKSWTYQIGRLDEWWFLVVSERPQALPEPLEVRSVETSQAYCWLFGYTKAVKLWSSPDRFLIAF